VLIMSDSKTPKRPLSQRVWRIRTVRFSDDDITTDEEKPPGSVNKKTTTSTGSSAKKRPAKKRRAAKNKEETGSSSKGTTFPFASSNANGSGGGKDAGSSGKKTAPPSASQVADGSGGDTVTKKADQAVQEVFDSFDEVCDPHNRNSVSESANGWVEPWFGDYGDKFTWETVLRAKASAHVNQMIVTRGFAVKLELTDTCEKVNNLVEAVKSGVERDINEDMDSEEQETQLREILFYAFKDFIEVVDGRPGGPGVWYEV